MQIKQYPHFLFVVSADGNAVQDDEGNWIVGEATAKLVSICREETDGRGSEIQVAGGTFHRFTSLIQLPKGSPRVEAGATVRICDSDDGTGVRIQGEVLKFDSSQLHSRLWV